MSNIVNKPILAYQLEYLQRHGIVDILITVTKKYVKKIQSYLEKYYKNLVEDPNVNVELVVFVDDIEPASALLSIQSKIYTNFIAILADVMVDVPLDEIIDTHFLT